MEPPDPETAAPLLHERDGAGEGTSQGSDRGKVAPRIEGINGPRLGTLVDAPTAAARQRGLGPQPFLRGLPEGSHSSRSESLRLEVSLFEPSWPGWGSSKRSKALTRGKQRPFALEGR
jgi:hypothetical protein